ncbi:heat-shock protein HtpX, partial [Streptomyces albidoflavus]
AAAFLPPPAGEALVLYTAGSAPAVADNPVAVAAMAEAGIDISGARPRALTPEDVRAADLVVTMGCGDTCPVLPGTAYRDWALDDPAGQALPAVRRVRDEIGRRVRELAEELGVAASA